MVALGVLTVIVMLVLILLFTRWIKAGRAVHLRPIPVLDHLPDLVSRAVEGGQEIHLSVGTGGITGATTAATLAGLMALEQIAERGSVAGAAPIVTVADPMVLPAAQDELRRAFTRAGRTKEYRPTQVEIIAPQPAIYALGAAMHLDSEETAANVMIGSFGQEALLLAEPGAQRGIAQTGGTDAPQAMGMLYPAVDSPIIGEEIFAIPAYLGRKPAHLASLRAQDVMRIGVAALIIIAALLRTLGISLF
jgi:hypothetical protein